ncbi:hypothetical protein BJ742DRAFT_878675, partial [Cladochytrium replicatum]
SFFGWCNFYTTFRGVCAPASQEVLELSTFIVENEIGKTEIVPDQPVRILKTSKEPVKEMNIEEAENEPVATELKTECTQITMKEKAMAEQDLLCAIASMLEHDRKQSERKDSGAFVEQELFTDENVQVNSKRSPIHLEVEALVSEDSDRRPQVCTTPLRNDGEATVSTHEDKQARPEFRDLVPWIPDDASPSEKLNTSIDKHNGYKEGSWDQFIANEELFGFTSDFDKLDSIPKNDDEDYRAREEEAARLADEIEREKKGFVVDDVLGTVSGGEGVDPSVWQFNGWDEEPEQEMSVAKQTLRDLGVNVKAMANWGWERATPAARRGRRRFGVARTSAARGGGEDSA